MQGRFKVMAIADTIDGKALYTFISEVYAINGCFFLLYNTGTRQFEWFGINDMVVVNDVRRPRVTLYKKGGNGDEQR